MSDTVNGTPAEITAAEITAAEQADGPLGRMRLMPSLSFGLRAAALSGVALPVVVLATSLSANGVAGVADAVALGTTCCPAVPN